MAGLPGNKQVGRGRIGVSSSNPWSDSAGGPSIQVKRASAPWEFGTPETEKPTLYPINAIQKRRLVSRPQFVIKNRPENIRRRLDNANNHFRRKAAEVFNDEAALRLLARMYQDVVVQIADFDSGKNGLPLAKLTAAHFCEIGENVIYITDAGQKFIESIEAYG